MDFESVPYLGDRSGLLFEKFHIDGPFSPEKVVSAQFGLFREQVRLSEFDLGVGFALNYNFLLQRVLRILQNCEIKES